MNLDVTSTFLGFAIGTVIYRLLFGSGTECPDSADESQSEEDDDGYPRKTIEEVH